MTRQNILCLGYDDTYFSHYAPLHKCPLLCLRRVHSVQFLSFSFSVYLSENFEVGLKVAYITANDLDIGVNGKVYEEIETSVPDDAWMDASKRGQLEDTLKFTFDYEKPFIKLNSKLDRELIDKYTIQFKACDSGNPKRYVFVGGSFIVMSQKCQ